MEKKIRKFSEKIVEKSNEAREKAREVRKRGILRKVEEEELNETFTGVDGGLIVKKFHGLTIVLTRACAASINYESSKAKSTEYYPKASPEIELYSLPPAQGDNKPSLIRASKEIETAIRSMNNVEMDYLLLDGSIIPRPADKPKENSNTITVYKQLIEKYKELFQTAREKQVQVIGVVEDTKARKLAGRMGADLLDTVLLDYALEPKERTKTFPYSDRPEEHPVLTSFPRETSDRIKVMYLKAVEEDRPLRIEYLSRKGTEEEADEIAGKILKISRISRGYSYPAPVIEADLRAKLTEKETQSITDRIKMYAGNNASLLEERRNTRPFK